MSALIIDKEIKKAVKDLIEHAQSHIISLEDMLAIKEGRSPPVGDRQGFSLIIPIEYRVVYSVEKHPKDFYRHISISVLQEYPSQAAVNEILRLFAFDVDVFKRKEGTLLWIEEDVRAINLLDKFVLQH